MKKEITNKDLAKGLVQVTKSISDLNKVVKGNAKSIEDLARITKNGFDNVNKRFEKVDKRFEKIDKRFEKVNIDTFDLKQGQEDIQSKLSNIAYRFEMEELEKRVKKLEFKLGLQK